MTALSAICLVLLALWFLVGVVPLPFIGGVAEHFPKRHPLIFVAVAIVLLAGVIGFHALGW